MEHILIAYYSHSKNTEKLANIIERRVGGMIFDIQPKDQYPSSYNVVVKQAKKEIQEGYMPKLKRKMNHMDSYSTIFIGTPNWWSTLAPPVASFLSEVDFSGKTIIPFCTHGGGGQGRIMEDIVKLCPKATVLDGMVVYGNDVIASKKQVIEWLIKIGIPMI